MEAVFLSTAHLLPYSPVAPPSDRHYLVKAVFKLTYTKPDLSKLCPILIVTCFVSY